MPILLISFLQDLFPDAVRIRNMGKELDILIQAGVTQLVRLLANSEKGSAIIPNQTGLTGRKTDLKKAIKLYRMFFNKSIEVERIILNHLYSFQNYKRRTILWGTS